MGKLKQWKQDIYKLFRKIGRDYVAMVDEEECLAEKLTLCDAEIYEINEHLDGRKAQRYQSSEEWFVKSPIVDNLTKSLSKTKMSLELDKVHLLKRAKELRLKGAEHKFFDAEFLIEEQIEIASQLRNKNYNTLDEWMQNSGKDEADAKWFECAIIANQNVKDKVAETMERDIAYDPYEILK